jgi:hypothetical protein
MFPAERTPEQTALAEAAAKVLREVFPAMGPHALETVLNEHTPHEAEQIVEAGKIEKVRQRDRVEACRMVMKRAYDRRQQATLQAAEAEAVVTAGVDVQADGVEFLVEAVSEDTPADVDEPTTLLGEAPVEAAAVAAPAAESPALPAK